MRSVLLKKSPSVDGREWTGGSQSRCAEASKGETTCLKPRKCRGDGQRIDLRSIWEVDSAEFSVWEVKKK